MHKDENQFRQPTSGKIHTKIQELRPFLFYNAGRNQRGGASLSSEQAEYSNFLD
jgi:hypothetical protein